MDRNATTRLGQRRPTVIAHRGASGYRPEHTLAAYALAIRQGADVIEPDVVSTSDGVLVARHENEISGTTDVATRSEFADRRTTKIIDAVSVTGWFTEDFTLAELRTLRAVERLPRLRPANTAYDGRYPIPTLAEVLDLARTSRTRIGEPVGVAPEIKHPSYFAGIGLPMEEPLVAALAGAGLDPSRVLVQCFEPGHLRRLRPSTEVRLLQLVDGSAGHLVSSSSLREVAEYAEAVGVVKDLLIPRDGAGRLLEPTDVIRNAHDVGLEVVGWTFRRENTFVPVDFRIGTNPAGTGNLAAEIGRFLDAGMDAFFTDNPDLGYEVVRRRS